jgi:hypothetical protein
MAYAVAHMDTVCPVTPMSRYYSSVTPFLQATKALRERYGSTLYLDLGTRRG